MLYLHINNGSDDDLVLAGGKSSDNHNIQKYLTCAQLTGTAKLSDDDLFLILLPVSIFDCVFLYQVLWFNTTF